MRFPSKRAAALALALLLLLSGCAKQERSAPDENGIMRAGDSLVEAPGALDEASVKAFVDKLKALRETYFPDSAVYYAAIPDKSHYAREQVTESLDHARITALLAEGLPDWKTAALDGALSLEDFYLTDPHWRQERLVPVLTALGESMGFTVDEGVFETQERDGFIGAYGKTETGLSPEPVRWLTSARTARATLWDFEHPDAAIYDESKLATDEPYDLFLSGAAALQVLEDPQAESGRDLILFRDSFGASLAPLLLEGYSRVILIDLRFMDSGLLSRYVEFGDADVLFLFSDRIINQSALLR